MRTHLLRFLRDEKGSPALEFALLALPLMLLFIGILEFGRVLYTNNSMARSADFAARLIYLDNAVTETALRAELDRQMPLVDASRIGLQITTVTPPGGGVAVRHVVLTYRFTFLVVPFFPSGLDLTFIRDVPIGT